jgi:hypothetical protein
MAANTASITGTSVGGSGSVGELAPPVVPPLASLALPPVLPPVPTRPPVPAAAVPPVVVPPVKSAVRPPVAPPVALGVPPELASSPDSDEPQATRNDAHNTTPNQALTATTRTRLGVLQPEVKSLERRKIENSTIERGDPLAQTGTENS